MIVPPPSFREIILGDVEKQLVEYRQVVGRAASGWTLSGDDKKTAHRALRVLELPAWSFRRDVTAVRKWWRLERDHERREMLVVYPHLFGEPRQWAEMRESDRTRRRETLKKLSAAVR